MPPGKKALAVKAISETDDTVTIGGYGFVWGGKDIGGDYFTPETDFWFDRITETPMVLYHHGMHPTIGKTVLGHVTKKTVDDYGLIIEAELKKSAKYVDIVRTLIKRGVLGWSGAGFAHLTEKDADGFMRSFPIGEFTLSPTPFEPRTLGVQELRSIADLEPALKAYLPQDVSPKGTSASASQGDGAAPKSTNVSIKGVTNMPPDEVQVQQEASPTEVTGPVITDEMMAKISERVTGEVLKALKALPTVNAAEPAVVKDHKKEREDALKAFDIYLGRGMGAVPAALKTTFQADSETGGAALIPPQEFVMSFIKAVDDFVFMRGLSKTFTLKTAQSLGFPSLETRAEDSAWTVELGTGEEEDTMAFGKREFKPYPMAKRVTISRTLLRQAPNAQTIVLNELKYKVGITQEKAFLEGHGANRPLGVFVASDQGISTGRDVTSTASGDFKADDFISMKYNLKQQYWAKAQWIIHRDSVQRIEKLKDGEGQYLWKDGLKSNLGIPTLCGFPVNMSEYAPSTFSSSAYIAVLADFSHYWIVDGLDMTIQRLDELYAETNQVGFILRYEGDGMPVIEEAYTRLKLL